MIECEQEEDGRWIAEVPELPGVQAYGATQQETLDRVRVLSLQVVADRRKYGDSVPQNIEAWLISVLVDGQTG